MPQSGTPETPAASPKRYTLEQLADMPGVQRAAYYKANPGEYDRLLGESLVEGLNGRVKQDPH
jgi:hypothetical protein